MKKICSLLIVALLLCSILCACSGSKTTETTTSVESISNNVDLQGILSSINSKYGLSDLKQVDEAKKLKRYYSIEEDDYNQFAAEFASDASTYNEVVIIEAKDSQTADKIATLLNNHLDSQISDAKSYSPESEEMLSKCKVSTYGNYISLVIGDDAESIQKEIEASVK